jgi:hypothetical protein
LGIQGENQDIVKQGCMNTGSHVAVGTKFCMVAPDVCGPSVQNLLLVIFLAPGLLN